MTLLWQPHVCDLGTPSLIGQYRRCGQCGSIYKTVGRYGYMLWWKVGPIGRWWLRQRRSRGKAI